METVLYADILFFINFSMDFITLYLTSRLSSGPPVGIRAVISAAIGGIIGTAATALGTGGIWGIVITVISSGVMVLIAFGFGEVSLFIKRVTVFWGGAALLGGIMSAVCSLGTGMPAGNGGGGTTVLLLGSVICIFIIRTITHFKGKRTLTVQVKVGDVCTKFEALLDSGNLLTDPLTGIPVIIADRSVMGTVVPAGDVIPQALHTRLRMIPARGIGGGGILTGIVPDSVTINSGKKEKECSAVIAVSDLGSTFFGGYPANAPTSVL